MIEMTISCAMCSKGKMVDLDTAKVSEATTLWDIVKTAGWISQQNGKNFDIYCSKRCAE